MEPSAAGNHDLGPNPDSSNPHQLPKQLAGLIFWILLLSFSSGDAISIGVALLLGGLTFADAWVSGIYKDPDKRSFLNISPMAWGIAMIGLHIIAYPVYVFNRNRMRTIDGTNGIFVAVVLLGGLTFVGAIYFIVSMFVGLPVSR